MIKFILIGCGRIGNRHAEHISNTGKLVASCDIDPEKANSISTQYGARSFNSLKALIDSKIEADVAVVCTPNGLHAEHSIALLKAGYHVLCEKPLAISVIDCGNMIKVAEQCNKRLFVVKQNRFNPPVEAVKKVIDEGILGKIYSIQLTCFWNRNESYYKNSWKGTKNLDGGTLYTQFSHFIDLLYWMFGDIRRSSGQVQNFKHQGIIEFEDCGVYVMEFYSGVIGTFNYSVNAYKKNMEGSLTILAEKGTIKIGGQYLNELEYSEIENYEIKDLPIGKAPNNYGDYQGSMSNHDKVYENLKAVLLNNAAISTSAFEGLKTVEIIDRLYNSAY
jgi:UDP-N-acetyl-2-amino-2-deoxyglucuronate dehydrogenase